jgi:heme/copper-type cytochrome/quinol oxidase subunit 1
MRKIVTACIIIPLVIVIVAFAVANRQLIAVSFDPFDSTQPAFSVRMPLFILIFILMGLGVLVGGVAAWLKQHKWRVRARRAEAEARDLRARLDEPKPQPGVPAALHSPPFAIPPAA